MATGPASAADAWPNEAPGSTVVFDWSFSALEGNGLINAGTRTGTHGEIVPDPSAPHSPPSVLKSARPPLKGGGVRLERSFSGGNRIYVAMKVKNNKDFQGQYNNNNKMILLNPTGMMSVLGLYGQRTSDASGPLFLAWGTNSIGVSNSHLNPKGYEILEHNQPNPNPFTRDVWHTVEMYAEASTTTTSRNGTVKWWLDGQLQGHYTTVNYGPGPFNLFQWTETWSDGDCGPGGFDPASGVCKATPINTTEWIWWLDHLRISVPTSAPDARPSAPSGVKVF